MQRFAIATLYFATQASALCEIIEPTVALISPETDLGDYTPIDIIDDELFYEVHEEDFTVVPTPTAPTNDTASKLPGKWTDEQKLTLESFKEIVATDVENIWVVAYVDPRCRDCLKLSLEWDKLTQIEEKEHRKIKLGYVDISVEENWKIVQDHTKGKKLTHTPAVTLYGDDKESPYFFPEDHEHTPDATQIHTWVSDYADHFGYGYWDPRVYTGAGVRPHYPYGNHYGNNYGGYGAHYGPPARPSGPPAKGHSAMWKGKDAYTNGRWQNGNQMIQLQAGKDSTVMRRRTVTSGGRLSGLAHDPYIQRPNSSYGGSQYQQSGNPWAVKSQVHSGNPWAVKSQVHSGNPWAVQSQVQSGNPWGVQSQKQSTGYYGAPANRYGSSSQGGYGGQRPASGYGKYGQNPYSQGYGAYGRSSGYGSPSYGNPYNSYGSNSYGQASDPYYNDPQGYGYHNQNPYGVGSSDYGQGHMGMVDYGFGNQGIAMNGDFSSGPSSSYQNASNGQYSSFSSAQAPISSYRNQVSPYGNQQYGHPAGQKTGTYGNPNTQYYGPGLAESDPGFSDGSIGIGSETYDPELGYGVIVGKYSETKGDTKKVTDYHQVEIAVPGSQMYEDAMQMAIRSGKGFTELNFDDQYNVVYGDMQNAYVEEDFIDRDATFTDEMTPELQDLPEMEDFYNQANYFEEEHYPTDAHYPEPSYQQEPQYHEEQHSEDAFYPEPSHQEEPLYQVEQYSEDDFYLEQEPQYLEEQYFEEQYPEPSYQQEPLYHEEQYSEEQVPEPSPQHEPLNAEDIYQQIQQSMESESGLHQE